MVLCSVVSNVLNVFFMEVWLVVWIRCWWIGCLVELNVCVVMFIRYMCVVVSECLCVGVVEVVGLGVLGCGMFI